MPQTHSDNQTLIPERRCIKAMRDLPLIYDEKKLPRSIALTDTALQSAKQFGEICGAKSVSGAVETALRLIRYMSDELLMAELQQMANQSAHHGLADNPTTSEEASQ